MLKNWALNLIALIGLFFLLAFLTLSFLAPLGKTLKCVKSEQTCYLHQVYVVPNKNSQSFSFNDIVDVQPVFWGLGRYGQKHYLLQITLEKKLTFQAEQRQIPQKDPIEQSSIVIISPSSDIAKKDANALKEYLTNQQTKELVLGPYIPISITFFFASLLFIGIGLLILAFLTNKTSTSILNSDKENKPKESINHKPI